MPRFRTANIGKALVWGLALAIASVAVPSYAGGPPGQLSNENQVEIHCPARVASAGRVGVIVNPVSSGAELAIDMARQPGATLIAILSPDLPAEYQRGFEKIKHLFDVTYTFDGDLSPAGIARMSSLLDGHNPEFVQAGSEVSACQDTNGPLLRVPCQRSSAVLDALQTPGQRGLHGVHRLPQSPWNIRPDLEDGIAPTHGGSSFRQ